MKSNLHYFKESILHKEGLIDPNYHFAVEKRIIPDTKETKNALTSSNEKVVQYIATIDTLVRELGHTFDSPDVVSLIEKIIVEFDTEGMNYSSLSQYFNVHNMNYSMFVKRTSEEKIQILKFILRHYITTRHAMYLSHGYSDMVLQVMCDNYSHKRKGSYGAKMIASSLSRKGLVDLSQEADCDFNRECYYLLADKTGKKLFKEFAKQKGIRLSDAGRKTEKFPDALIKIGAEYYIVEQKNMKEDGGGQDKQAREITDFIYRPPEFQGLHYVTYMNGVYVNTLSAQVGSKKRQQYDDIVQSLKCYPSNYFVNEFAFNELIQDALSELKL